MWTHRSDVAVLSFVTGGAGQTLQSDGSGQTWESTRALISLLAEHALLTSGTCLAVGTCGSWSSDHTLGATRAWWSKFTPVSFASLLAGTTNLSLVTVLSGRSLRAGGTGQADGPLDAIATGWA